MTEKVRLMNTFPWRMGEIPEIKDTQFFFGFSFNPLHHSKPSQITDQWDVLMVFWGNRILTLGFHDPYWGSISLCTDI